MLYEKEAKGTVAEVTEKIGAAAAASQFAVLGTHNLKEKMVAKGVIFDRESRVVELCSPLQAKEMLALDMSISTVLPCRIAVFEDGDKVMVSAMKLTTFLRMFDNATIGPVAKELDETIARIIDEACK